MLTRIKDCRMSPSLSFEKVYTQFSSYFYIDDVGKRRENAREKAAAYYCFWINVFHFYRIDMLSSSSDVIIIKDISLFHGSEIATASDGYTVL